jgi:hypothetical protein
MAEIQQTQVLPAPFIEAAGKTYLQDLSQAVGGIKGLDLSKLYGPQFVAGQSALQTQAEGLSYWFRWLSTFSYKQLKLQQVLLHINNICLRINKM